MTSEAQAPDTASAGPSLRCIELVELVTDYLEGRLTSEARATIDEHLAGCEGCTTYVEQIRQTAAAAGRLPPEAVPEEAIDRLLAVFRRARTG